MTETERNQIKGALLKCAEENEKLKEQCLILAEGRRIVGYGRSKPILKGV